MSVACILEVFAELESAESQCSANAARMLFAWLYAARQRRLHEIAQPELRNALGALLSDSTVVSLEPPEQARGLSEIWRDAQAYWHMLGTVQDKPSDFVCDISKASVVYRTIADMRASYERFAHLDWENHGAVLVRTANGFHGENFDPRGRYRSLVLWLAVNTSVGPLVIQVELHLEECYKRRKAALLLADFSDGVFEPSHIRDSWKKLIHALSELASARAARRAWRLEAAMDVVREALKAPALAHLAAGTTIRDALLAAEQELHRVMSEERALRNSHDSFEARMHFLKPQTGICHSSPECVVAEVAAERERALRGLVRS